MDRMDRPRVVITFSYGVGEDASAACKELMRLGYEWIWVAGKDIAQIYAMNVAQGLIFF